MDITGERRSRGWKKSPKRPIWTMETMEEEMSTEDKIDMSAKVVEEKND